jgi:hypothetical protein
MRGRKQPFSFPHALYKEGASMSKIYSFVIIIPLIMMLIIKGVFFYEYDTKQRYIKDIIDTAAYNVKITGCLTQEAFQELKTELSKYAFFEDTSIILEKGLYSNGNLIPAGQYIPGTRLYKGDSFMIYVKSSDVSNYSKIENTGVCEDDSRNLYFSAKAVCRVEYLDRGD